jgi:hypothetical protein
MVSCSFVFVTSFLLGDNLYPYGTVPIWIFFNLHAEANAFARDDFKSDSVSESIKRWYKMFSKKWVGVRGERW